MTLVQLCILRLCPHQKSCVGVGVLPDRKELLIGSLGLGGIARQGIGPRQPEVRERTNWLVSNNSGMVDNLLKLARCRGALFGREIRLAAQVDGIEGKSESGIALAQFVG